MLDECPELKPEAAYYMNAFQDLSTSRERTEVVQPIKVTEIKSYCELVGELEPLDFMWVIKKLDRVFLKFYDDKPR